MRFVLLVLVLIIYCISFVDKETFTPLGHSNVVYMKARSLEPEELYTHATTYNPWRYTYDNYPPHWTKPYWEWTDPNYIYWA